MPNFGPEKRGSVEKGGLDREGGLNRIFMASFASVKCLEWFLQFTLIILIVFFM